MYSPAPIHEQLRAAREAGGHDLAALAARVGMRQAIVRAIDEGRFDDLPSGIYGRAAIRAYATAVGCNPADVLAACEPLLRPMEDPVARLAYLRGVRHHAPAAAAPGAAEPGTVASTPEDTSGTGRALRSLAAAGIDAAVVVAALLAVIAATTMFCGLPPSGLGPGSAAGFGMMGVVLGLTYFACVGGVAGATVGEQLARTSAVTTGRLRLGDVLARAVHCATIDVRAIVESGERVAAWALRPHGRLQSSHSPSEG